LSVDLLDNGKVVYVDGDLSKVNFGLDSKIYDEVCSVCSGILMPRLTAFC
jgi:thioester reductase-like protein